MRGPAVCSRLLIATLVAWLAAGPARAAPLVLPTQVTAAAGAGPKLVVVIVPLDAPSRATQGLLELTAEASVTAAGRFELVPAVEAFDPKAAAERAAKVDSARARMVEGQKALDDLDTAKGTEAFADALRLFKETDTSRTFDDLVKAWVMKAASHALGGEVPPTKQEIERIIAVQPKAEFNAQFFPPELLKFVEQQRKLANNAKGELTVRTEPPGANVWVNGQLQGRAPLSVKGLLGSRHEVVAALGGSQLTLAELPPGDTLLELKPAELQPALVKAIDAVTKSPKSAARDQALVSLGKKLGAEQVLAFLVKKSTAGEQFELTALRLEVRDGHNAAYGTATQALTEPSDALKGFVDSLLAADAPRQGKNPLTHFDGDGGGGSGKTVVGIALLGGAVALLGGGIAAGAIGQDRYNLYRATPQVQTRISQAYADEARGLGGASLGMLIGAGVAAGVGAFMLATAGSSSGAADEEPEPKKPTKKKSEPRKTEPRKTEPKKEEPVKDEPKKEEPKKDEPKKEEPKKDEPPAKVDPKEEKRRKEEEARKAKEEEARLKKEEEQRAKDEAEAKKKAEAEEKKRKEEEKRAEEERKKQEAADKKGGKKAEEARKKAEAEAAAKAEEEKKKKEAEELKKKEDEEKKRREEEEKKKLEQKKKDEDHDDLRNF